VGQIGQSCSPHIASSSNDTNESLTANDSEVLQVLTLNSDTSIISGGRRELVAGKVDQVDCSVPFSKRFGSTNSSHKLIRANLFTPPVASPNRRVCLAAACAEGLWKGDRSDYQCEGLRLYHVRLYVARRTLSQPCTVFWISR
jgi:hypothetical protein